VHYGSELIATLRLIRSENIGPKTCIALISHYGSACEALKKVIELSKCGRLSRNITLCSEEHVALEIEATESCGAELISYQDECYPALLKEIANYPPIITVAGRRRELLQGNKVALVGSRNASISGANFAHKIAAELSDAGLVVVSGLARGIDAHAHLGSLDKGTIAVVGCGIDQIYPPENKDLYTKIMENGLIITEQAFGSMPKAAYFPQRNRIISGLSLATVVIEAGLKSGSLITADFALEQNREVFATPGFPLDYRYSGTNKLIKQGANLLESSEDILHVLGQQPQELFKNSANAQLSSFKSVATYNVPMQKDLAKTRELVLSSMSAVPVGLNQLAELSSIPLNLLSIAVVELELQGKLERVGSNQFVLIS
jgi:DNA processing protein